MSSITLVSSFDPASYPYSTEHFFADRMDPNERTTIHDKFIRAFSTAGITDYHLIEGASTITGYVKTAEDQTKMSAAYHINKVISVDVFNFPASVTNRTVDRYRKMAEKLIKGTPVEDNVSLMIDRGKGEIEIPMLDIVLERPAGEGKSLIVAARTGFDFLMFDRLVNQRRPRSEINEIYAVNFG